MLLFKQVWMEAKNQRNQPEVSKNLIMPDGADGITRDTGQPSLDFQPPINGQKATILIANNDPGYCALLRCFFEDEGWNVITVATAESLKQRALEAHIWLVDVKLSMLHRDGITAVIDLRQGWTSPCRMPPVVFFSGLGESECTAELKALRDRYLWLRKPCRLAMVAAMVKQAMDHECKPAK
jgi:DNA-binding NtrC family response regulator